MMSFHRDDVLLDTTYFVGGPMNVTEGNHSSTVDMPGCDPDDQPWCRHQHKVYLFQYLIGLPTLTIGYCASSLLCYTIFSKILGPWPQVYTCIITTVQTCKIILLPFHVYMVGCLIVGVLKL